MTYHLHNKLLEEVKKKIPKSSEMVRFLMDTLSMENMAVYRRISGKVPFSLQEAAVIAKKLSLSLDELIGIEMEKSKTFRIKLPDFVYPDDNDQHMFLDFIDFLESISYMETTETGVVTNAIPQELFSNFEFITKLNIFKWQYFYNYEKRSPYKDLVVPKMVQDSFKKQSLFAKNFKKTYYVFDRRIFIRLVKEIEYFKSIRLIDAESANDIKNDLLLLINYLEDITRTGVYPETGNKVFLYITDMEVPFSCTYIKANDIEYTLMKAFVITSATSFDKLVYKKTKDWINSSMRTSTLITGTSDIQRLEFFEKQKEIVLNS